MGDFLNAIVVEEVINCGIDERSVLSTGFIVFGFEWRGCLGERYSVAVADDRLDVIRSESFPVAEVAF